MTLVDISPDDYMFRLGPNGKGIVDALLDRCDVPTNDTYRVLITDRNVWTWRYLRDTNGQFYRSGVDELASVLDQHPRHP